MISRYYDIIKEARMNKSNTPTSEKIMIPLRLPPKLYDKMMAEVHKRKKKKRGYSVNELLTDILEKELQENSDG